MEYMTKDPIKMIQGCRAKGEPFFVIRAQDMCSIAALGSYNMACSLVGVSENQLAETQALFREFTDWQHKNNARVKVPDLPRVESKGGAHQPTVDNTTTPPGLAIRCTLREPCTERNQGFCTEGMTVMCSRVPEEFVPIED